MRKLSITALMLTMLTFFGTPRLVDACAGLIGSNGAVNLGRTTTLAAYHDGVEHYVTSFEFLGGGGEFGTLIPLPGVPTNVERGGAWTLQRLVRETQPKRVVPGRRADERRGDLSAEVLIEVRIDALDITVLKGGAAGRSQVGDRPRLPALAGRAGGARLLRAAQPDLPGRGVRRRRGQGSAASRSVTGRPYT